MKIIGRNNEKQILEDCLHSGRPEFLVVYGRRRVGKTFLVRQFFSDRFSFYSTGVAKIGKNQKLKLFHDDLKEQGLKLSEVPKDWVDAFRQLRELLSSENVYREPTSGRKIVFLDELPWMDSARSDFLPALDHFWNSWASAQKDLMLIVCGSATSWIISNLLQNTGGLYNRLTWKIHLQPFSLKECEEFLVYNQIPFTRRLIVESYMIFGGIPFYLNYLSPRLSLAQNVEELCFKPTGQLHDEFNMLFSSLFTHHEKRLAVLSALATRGIGLTRAELEKIPEIGGGAQLSKILMELEQCDFIRKYTSFARENQGHIFQLIDPFTLFSFRFLQNQTLTSWMSYITSPSYHAWSGIAFEMVCLHHTSQMKEVLGIRGIQSADYAWRSSGEEKGAQIDLVIDRRDEVINLCEMKFTAEPFVVDASYENSLIHKREAFRAETGTQKSLFLTMISEAGVQHNGHAGCLQNIITGDDLFISE